MSGRVGTEAGERGLGTMLRILWSIERRAALLWLLVLGASMIGTIAGIVSLYDSPAKIHTYAAAVTAGSSLVAINGRVEGIDSLGGVIQDEFGFLGAFLLPLLGVSMVARSTRREEESGRLELLLGGRIARSQPTLAALLLASATIVTVGTAFAVGLVVFGVPVAGSVLYALSLAALASVFAGLAALLAQVVPHARGIYTWSLLILALSYVARGVGEVTRTWLTWLSPLGWADKAAAFGEQRWWTLGIPVGMGLALAVAALALAGRRDLGSALFPGRAGPVRATAWLRGEIGFAARIHRPAVFAWLAGGVLLAGMMGALARQFLGALAGNAQFAAALGMAGGRPAQELVTVTQVYLAVIATGYSVQAIGPLRAEEAAGRLETRLSGTLSRTRWLAAHALVVLGGVAAIVLLSSLVLGVTTALSLGDTAAIGSALGSGIAYLPAELVLAGLALALYGLRPRLFGMAWAAYAAVAFIALLGAGLRLPRWVLDLSPTEHVGNPPAGPVTAGALAVLVGIAAALVVVSFAAFRRRGIPQD